MKLESAAEVKQQLNEERISVLETFDVKFTNPRGGRERREIDIRIKFEEGRPKALITRKNDAKIVIFDVLCLHRCTTCSYDFHIYNCSATSVFP